MKKHVRNRFKVITSFIVAFAMVITMISPVPALAGSTTTDEYLLSRGSQTIEKSVPGGHNDEWIMNFKNDTSGFQNFKVEFKITGDFSRGYKPEVSGMPFYKWTINGNECTGVYEENPQAGEVKSLGFKFGPSFPGEYLIVAKLTVNDLSGGGDSAGGVTGEGIPVVNHDKNNPTPAVNNQKYLIMSSGSNYFVIDSPNAIAIKAEVDGGTDLARQNSYGSFEKINNPNDVVYLKAGKNVFETRTGPASTGYVKFIYEDYDFGKATIKWPVATNKLQAGVGYTFTVDYVPGKNFGQPNDSRISMIGNMGDGDIDPNKTVIKGSYKFPAPGEQEFKIKFRNEFTNNKNDDVSKTTVLKYTIIPKALGFTRSCKGTHNSLTFGLPKEFSTYSNASGDYIVLQKKVGAKWVNVSTKRIKSMTDNGTFTAKNLKGNTSYTFRFMGKLSAKNGKPELWSAPGKNFTRKTAPAIKPIISSASVYNAKSWKTEDKYIGGHWVGNTWYKGYWQKGEWRTSYKIKVTLKKTVPGMNGVLINGKAVKGNGRTFVVSTYSGGKVKGKNIKVAVRVYGSTQSIVGPYSASRSVRIR